MRLFTLRGLVGGVAVGKGGDPMRTQSTGGEEGEREARRKEMAEHTRGAGERQGRKRERQGQLDTKKQR